MAALSALLFTGGRTQGEVLALGTYPDQQAFVKECLKKLWALSLAETLVNGHLVVEETTKISLKSSSSGRLIKQSDSLYDLLLEESERFFDVPKDVLG